MIADETVRFLIDDDVARRAGLQISRRVLALALRPDKAREERR